MIVHEWGKPHGFEGDWKCEHCTAKWEMETADFKRVVNRGHGSFTMSCPSCERVVGRMDPKHAAIAPPTVVKVTKVPSTPRQRRVTA